MAQEEISKPKGQKHSKLMLVRYGRMSVMGWFEHNEAQIPKNKSHVIVKSDRGLELGQLVGPFNYRSGNYRATPEQVEAYFTQGGKEFSLTSGGRFVRFATHEDIREQEHLEASAVDEAKCCQKFADELGLNMKVIEAEHLFGGERIIFYFTSDGRVDFRELVKRLAREYQTRIELRQIGSRDEARLISDYESCGLECCCKRFLKILDPVNMRMAKLQKATLDPSKISGHCGRLKCCLRYEDQTYRQLKNNLPSRNTVVKTSKGTGKVVDVQVLTQLVVVQLDNGDRLACPVDEIQILRGKPISDSEDETQQSAEEQSQELDVLGDDLPARDTSDRNESQVDEEVVFEEIEAAFEEVREIQEENKSQTSPERTESANHKQTEPGSQEQSRSSQTDRQGHADQSRRQGKNRRKNRRGRNRRRRSQNDGNANRQGNASNQNKPSGSQGS